MGTAPTLQTSASVLSPAMKPPMTAMLRNLVAGILQGLCLLAGIQLSYPLPVRAFGGNALDLRSHGAYAVQYAASMFSLVSVVVAS